MVQPEYNVVVIVKSGGGDRYRLIGVLRKDGQRAGSIEGKAPDCTRINAVLMEDALNRIADASPDIVRGLFLQDMSAVDSSSRKRGLHIIALFGLPQADVLRGHAKNVTFGIDDTSPGTAGADVDSNVILHVWVQLVVRIGGQLARLLPGWLSKWKGRHIEKGGPCFNGPAVSADSSLMRGPIGLVTRCLAMAK